MAAVVKKLNIDRNQIIATAQAMHEVRGTSLAEISKIIGVSKTSIQKWKTKYQWKSKKADLPKVIDLTRQTFIEGMAKEGMPPEKALKLMVKGMTEPKTDQIVEKQVERNKKGDLISKEYRVAFEGFADEGIRHKYHHDYMLAAGLIGNSKGLEINNNGEGSVNIQVNLAAKKGEND